MKNLKKVSDTSFNDAVNEVEESNYRQMDLNTPNVSEDGYIHDVPMLYGYKDPVLGYVHNTFTYREMDGRDEEAINKNEVRSNGAKLANVLVERCVSEIGGLKKKDLGVKAWGDIIRSLYGGDIDYMMLKIRELSKGNIITFTHKCPQCGTKLITELRTDEVKITPFSTAEIPFSLSKGYRDNNGKFHKTGFLKLANGYDREIITPLFAKNNAVAVTTLLSRVMTFDDEVPIFMDNVKSMSVRDRGYLENLLKDANYGIDISLEDVHCTSCGRDLSEERSTSDFF